MGERQNACGNDDVVHQRRHRAHRETPLETDRHVSEDAQQHPEHGQSALFCQFLADLWADIVHPADVDCTLTGLLQGLQHGAAEFRAAFFLISRCQSYSDGGGIAKLLHDIILKSARIQAAAHGVQFHRLLEAGLNQCATGKIETEIKTAGKQRSGRSDDQQNRQDKSRPAQLEKVDMRLFFEKFHKFSLLLCLDCRIRSQAL